jgi:hypothetical protein
MCSPASQRFCLYRSDRLKRQRRLRRATPWTILGPPGRNPDIIARESQVSFRRVVGKMDTNLNAIHILIAMLLLIAWFVANGVADAAYQSRLARVSFDVNAHLPPMKHFPTIELATQWEHRRQYKRLLKEYRRLVPTSGIIEEMRNLRLLQTLLFTLVIAAMAFYFGLYVVLTWLIFGPVALIDIWLLHNGGAAGIIKWASTPKSRNRP